MRNKISRWMHTPAFWLTLIVCGGSLVRLAALDKWPLGLHQDEAYSAYNAWSVLHYGLDSEGYVRPVYYTVWGSGMSVLYSYLEMPFIALLGTTVWAIRLPQALLGCVSIAAAYFLGKEVLDFKVGIAFAGMVAINPWHILQSRFGLDANLAVPMLLFGVLFLCRYLNGKRRSIFPAAVFFGLTLYCYAITWPLVPLLLFMAVNYGWIPEIRTSLFSIPKLAEMRTAEFGFGSFRAHVKWMLAMLLAQHDDIWWITNEKVGAYYYISTPFILLGMCLHGKTFWDCVRKKEPLPLHFMFALWFCAMFIVSCGIDTAKYYKVNCLHLPIIFYGVYGLVSILGWLGRWKWLPAVVSTVYLGLFGYFIYTEVSRPADLGNAGQLLASHMLYYRYEEALDTAQSLTDGEISIINLNYANVLLYSKMAPEEFQETAVFAGDNLAFRDLASFGRFYFGVYPSEETADWVYVFPYSQRGIFEEAGYQILDVTECYGVAYLK